MSTLLLRLAGPMQSWGTDSRFDIRFTGREPSKSGVIGLLCAALGKPREERPDDGHPPLAALAALRMGVRVDRPGALAMDYQTAGGTHLRGERYGVVNASGSSLSTVQSRRYYLADASFLIGLEGEDALLRRLDAALAAPVWQLCLGRKAFVPGEPVRLAKAGPDSGFWPRKLENALTTFDWPEPRPPAERADRLAVVVDTAADPNAEMRQDVPLDFAARRFGVRYVRRAWVTPPDQQEDV